jgi:hypothetical protein
VSAGADSAGAAAFDAAPLSFHRTSPGAGLNEQ